jgi:hypothetical protein
MQMFRPLQIALPTALLLQGCASTPPATAGDTPPTNPTAAVSAPPSASSAVASDPPVALAPTEAPFVRVATLRGGAELQAISGTLAAFEIRQAPSGIDFEVFVYELAEDRFKAVGALPFSGMTSIEGVTGKLGGPLAVVSLSPYGRGAMKLETPIRGGGKASPLGDPMSEAFAEAVANQVPSCGQPIGENKLAAMKNPGQVYEDGDALLVEGESCEKKRAVQVRRSSSTAATFREIGARDTLGYGVKGVYLLGEHVELYHDGEFKPVAPRLPEAFSGKDGLAVAYIYQLTDGTQLAHGGGRTFVLRNDKWIEARLPDGGAVASLLWDQKTLWALGSSREEAALFRYVAPGSAAPAQIDTKALERPDDSKAAPAPLKLAAPGPRCKNHVVVLYGFTKVTPLDYDYPLTRKAVKGHMELEGVRFAVTEDGGKRYFVGLAPSFDKAKKLVKVVEASVSGSKPQVVCAEPRVIRELGIDLATGNVK